MESPVFSKTSPYRKKVFNLYRGLRDLYDQSHNLNSRLLRLNSKQKTPVIKITSTEHALAQARNALWETVSSVPEQQVYVEPLSQTDVDQLQEQLTELKRSYVQLSYRTEELITLFGEYKSKKKQKVETVTAPSVDNPVSFPKKDQYNSLSQRVDELETAVTRLKTYEVSGQPKSENPIQSEKQTQLDSEDPITAQAYVLLKAQFETNYEELIETQAELGELREEHNARLIELQKIKQQQQKTTDDLEHKLRNAKRSLTEAAERSNIYKTKQTANRQQVEKLQFILDQGGQTPQQLREELQKAKDQLQTRNDEIQELEFQLTETQTGMQSSYEELEKAQAGLAEFERVKKNN